MFNFLKMFLAVGSVGLALWGCVASPYGTSGRVVIQDEHASIDIAFNDHDRALIRGHYGAKHKGKYKKLPPGLAKKNKLPPGIRKQLVRRGQLPSGLYYQRLPYELERRMSRIPDGYIRVIVEGTAVLFNEHTRVIFDVIHDL